jgi:poly-gamma-glutamate synthesis protein (capsule biosynthesis protein)
MTVTVALTGQCLLHGDLDLAGSAAVRDMLAADVAVGNFEAAVTAADGWPTKTRTVHPADPEAVAALRRLGVTVLAHANNHAFDLGPPGLAATRRAADAAGLGLVGSGADLAGAARPVVVTTAAGPDVAVFSVDLGPQPDIVYAGAARAGVAGLRMRRAVAMPPERLALLAAIHADLGDDARAALRRRVGFDPEPAAGTALAAFGTAFVAGDCTEARWTADAADRARLVAAIDAEKRAGRVVVVATHGHHWDADWSATPAWFLALAEDLVAAGADVIAGTGAPVLQPLHLVGGRAVFSSLGNAVFQTGRPERYAAAKLDVWSGVAVRLTLADDGRLIEVALLPLAAGPAVPPSLPSSGPTCSATPTVPPGPAPLAGDAAAVVAARLVAPLATAERARIRLAV